MLNVCWPKHVDYAVSTAAFFGHPLIRVEQLAWIVTIPDAGSPLRLPISLHIATIAETAFTFVLELVHEQILPRMLLVQLLMAQITVD